MLNRRRALRSLGWTLGATAAGTVIGLTSKVAQAAPNLEIREVFIPYGGTASTTILPANAKYIGALDNSGSAIGGGSGFVMLFEVDSSQPGVSRTFRSFKQGQLIDGAVYALLGLGWFQRLGTGLVTRFAVYEQI